MRYISKGLRCFDLAMRMTVNEDIRYNFLVLRRSQFISDALDEFPKKPKLLVKKMKRTSLDDAFSSYYNG